MVYNINYLTSDGEVIDETQVDENDDELIWDLFREFGHTRTEGTHYEVEEVEKEEKYYSISGYWKDNQLTFDNYIATSAQDSFQIKYPDDKVFIFGFNPDTFDDADLAYVITEWREI